MGSAFVRIVQLKVYTVLARYALPKNYERMIE